MNTISESANPWRPSVELAVVPAQNAPVAIGSENDSGEEGGFNIFGDDGFTFSDFLDIINPLQHIPIVGTLYREMTGDELDPGSRVIGDTLFMGPVGTVAAIANVIVDDATGKDMGEHVMAFFEAEDTAYPEVSDAGSEPVAAGAARPAALNQPGIPEVMDPVTAWAMAETSFRKAAAGQTSAVPANTMPYQAPYQERAALSPAQAPAPVSLNKTAGVANWATAEASYRKSAAISGTWTKAAPKPVPAPQPKDSEIKAQASPDKLLSGAGALAALRRDLKAGAVAKTSGASNAAAAIQNVRKDAASFAAVSYDRAPKPAPATNTQARRSSGPRPAGAVAAEGGWFTNTMLSALDKRDNAAEKNQNAPVNDSGTGTLDLAR